MTTLATSSRHLATGAISYDSTQALSAEQQVRAKSNIGIPVIEAYSAALVGDGVTDDSTAIKSAHDAAYAAGIRELRLDRDYYAPTAYNIGDVIFRGPGSLIGTYGKRVIPDSVRAFYAPSPKLIPAIHLPNFSKSVTPTVVVL